MSFDLKTAIAGIAPTLATMMGGPLLGTAVTALEGAFGLQPGAGVDGITKVVQSGAMTPEIISAVRAADQRHAEIMGQQGIDLVKLNADHEAAMAVTDAGDRDSARKMQIANHSRVPAALTVFLTLAVVAIIVTRLMHWAPASADSLLESMIGALITVWLGSCQYWFGTTRNSFDKTQLLAQSAPPGAAPASA